MNKNAILLMILLCFVTTHIKGDLHSKVHHKFVQISSLEDGKHLAIRWIKGKWRIQTEQTDHHDPSTKFYLDKIGNKLRIRSYIAGGRTLNENAVFAKFNKKGTWNIAGNSLAKCQIKKGNKPLYVGKKWGLDNAVLTSKKVTSGSPTEFSIELPSHSPMTFAHSYEGSLSQISVGSHNHVCGINNNSEPVMLKKDGDKVTFEKMGAIKLKQISVGRDGFALGITKKNELKRWNGKKWKDENQKLSYVSVGNKKNICGISTDHKPLHKQHGKWKPLPNNFIYYTLKHGKKKKPVKTSGHLKKISIGNDGKIYGVLTTNRSCELIDDQWVLNGNLKHVSVGHHRNVWGIKKNGALCWHNGTKFEELSTVSRVIRFKNISAGSGKSRLGTSLWGITTKDEIYEIELQNWTHTPSSKRLKKISVGNEEHVWGLNMKGFPLFWKQNQWNKDSENVFVEISAEETGIVWGLTKDGSLYKRNKNGKWSLHGNKKFKYICTRNNENRYALGTNYRLYKNWNEQSSGDIGKETFNFVSTTNDGTVFATMRSNKDSHRYNDKLCKIEGTSFSYYGGVTPWHKNKFYKFSCNTVNGKTILWAITPSNDLAKLENGTFRYVGGGIKDISVGSDGTTWAITTKNVALKIQQGPKEIDQEGEHKRRKKEFENHMQTIKEIEAEKTFDAKMELVETIPEKNILFSNEYFYPYLTQLDEMLHNRQKGHLKKLQSEINRILKALRHLQKDVSLYGEQEIKSKTTFGKEEIREKIDELSRRREIAAKERNYRELVEEATRDFKSLAAKATDIEKGKPGYDNFIKNTDKWLVELDEVVSRIEEDTKGRVNKLFITSGKKQPTSIQEHFEKYTAWAIKLKEPQRKAVKGYLEKVILFEKKKRDEQEKAVKQKEAEEAAKKENEKATPEKVSASLTQTSETIFTAADSPGSIQESWFKDLQDLVTNITLLPIEKIGTYKELMSSLEESTGYFQYPKGQERNKKTRLNSLIAEGKEFYKKIALQLKADTRNVGLRKTDYRDWLARLQYLYNDMEGRDEKTEFPALRELISEIERYDAMFKRTFKSELKARNDIAEIVTKIKLSLSPAPYKKDFLTAQKMPIFSQKTFLAKQAVKKIPKTLSPQERMFLIQTYVNPLVIEAFATEAISKNVNELRSLKTLLTVASDHHPAMIKAALEKINPIIAGLEKKSTKKYRRRR